MSNPSSPTVGPPVQADAGDSDGTVGLPRSIAPAPTIELHLEPEPGAPAAAQLFALGRRDNPRRAVLFVSLVLGKHVPVPPHRVVAAADLLATKVATVTGRGTDVDVLGFCETATGLGHLVADRLDAAAYAHSTRRPGSVRPLSGFEEEHSHATSHQLALSDPGVFDSRRPLVLVDDEFTTGRTIANTIRALHLRWPRTRYVIAAFLDWRASRARAGLAALGRELGATIDAVSLRRGAYGGEVTVPSISAPRSPGPRPPAVAVRSDVAVHRPTVSGTVEGRHGLDREARRAVRDQAVTVASGLGASLHPGGRTAVIGTEEFLAFPLRVAEALAEHGPGGTVTFHSTTRSPIVVADVDGYPVRSRRVFPGFPDPDRTTFCYNLPEGGADDVVVIFDPDHPDPLSGWFLDALRPCATSCLHVVHLRRTP